MKTNQKFQDLDVLFEQQKKNITGPAELKKLIQNFNFTVEEFSQDLEYPEDLPYGRTLLFQSENFEAILMNWKPKQASNIHDHGNSFGCVNVLTGDVNNVAFDKDLNKTGTFKQTKGDLIEVPKGIFHKIENLNDDYSVSLHFYAPPINGMKVIDAIDFTKAYIVKSDSGAWNPEKNEIVEFL